MEGTRRLVGVLACAALVAASSAVADIAVASESDPIIGTWVLDLERSKYEVGQPPRSAVRKFDYTRDGLILVTLDSVNAQGAASSTHWYLSLDGREQPEYTRAEGTTPILWIAIKPIDGYTKELTGRKLQGGTMTITTRMTFTVSQDRKTLTITYKDPVTGKETNTAVYDRQ